MASVKFQACCCIWLNTEWHHNTTSLTPPNRQLWSVAPISRDYFEEPDVTLLISLGWSSVVVWSKKSLGGFGVLTSQGQEGDLPGSWWCCFLCGDVISKTDGVAKESMTTTINWVASYCSWRSRTTSRNGDISPRATHASNPHNYVWSLTSCKLSQSNCFLLKSAKSILQYSISYLYLMNFIFFKTITIPHSIVEKDGRLLQDAASSPAPIERGVPPSHLIPWQEGWRRTWRHQTAGGRRHHHKQ